MNKKNIILEASNSVKSEQEERLIEFADKLDFEIITPRQFGYIVFKDNSVSLRANEKLEVFNVIAKHKNPAVPDLFFIMIFLNRNNICATNLKLVKNYQKIY